MLIDFKGLAWIIIVRTQFNQYLKIIDYSSNISGYIIFLIPIFNFIIL